MSDIKWPTKFRIKSRSWTISYVPKQHGCLRESDADPEDYCLGVCIAHKRKIYICNDQSDCSKRDTLVHELMHAVYSTMPSIHDDDPERFEENFVLAATEAFFEIIGNSETSWFLGEEWEE